MLNLNRRQGSVEKITEHRPKATKKLRERVRELTSKRQNGKDVKQIVAELTPAIRGWGNYFRSGNAEREFNKMDYFVVKSLRRWQFRRGDQLYGMGLHKLIGTVKYPAQATPPKILVKPYGRKPHAQFERGLMESDRHSC